MSDTTLTHLQSLLDCAEEKVDPAACRVFMHPGPDAPWDSCEKAPNGADGQLWVAHLRTTPGWPPGFSSARNPSECEHQDTAFFEVGVLRCAQGVVRDDGSPPTVEQINTDAVQQQADRWALREAIACCFLTDRRNLLLVEWNAIPPLGACVGGTWQVAVRIGNCSCQDGGS